MKTAFAVLAVLGLCLSVSYAQSVDISVPNGSFEDPVGPDGVTDYTPNDWDCVGDSIWVRNPQSGEFTDCADPNTLGVAGGEGLNCLIITINPEGSCTATTAGSLGTVAAGSTYDLTAALGNDGYATYQPEYTISLLFDGEAVASNIIDGYEIDDLTFSDYSLSYTAQPADANKHITIQLAGYNERTGQYESNWCCFDNVRLTETAADLTPGDTDGDGDVDLDDFNVLKNNFESGPGRTWAEGDFTDDGEVKLDDFNLLKNNFTGGAAVPEPATLSLLAVASLGLIRRKKA